MFATLAPVEARQEDSADAAEDRRIRRAVGIAFNTAATIACAALAFSAMMLGTALVRVVLRVADHREVPFASKLLAALGLCG